MKYLFTALFVLLAATQITAQEWLDTFTGTAVDINKWYAPYAGYGMQAYQNNELVLTGTSTDTSPAGWRAQGELNSLVKYSTQGLTVSTKITATGAASGWWVGFYFIQDDNNWINFYRGQPYNGVTHTGYSYSINGVSHYNQPLRISPAGSVYSMKYSEGAVSFFVDGIYLGKQNITLSSVQVSLRAATRYKGDWVEGRFDDFRLSPVPEPSSLAALLCGFSGVVGTVIRKRKQ